MRHKRSRYQHCRSPSRHPTSAADTQRPDGVSAPPPCGGLGVGLRMSVGASVWGRGQGWSSLTGSHGPVQCIPAASQPALLHAILSNDRGILGEQSDEVSTNTGATWPQHRLGHAHVGLAHAIVSAKPPLVPQDVDGLVAALAGETMLQLLPL